MSNLLVHNSAISVSRSKQLVMVLEVKKVVSSDSSMIDHLHLIEMLLYARYLISMNQLETLIGGITDGVNTHCIKFQLNTNKLKMVKSGHMKEKLNILEVLTYFAN